MKRLTLICDLDGTLCDIDHRRMLFDGGHYDAFHSCIPGDKPKLSVASVVALHLEFGYHVIFLTGRAERYRDVTEMWMQYHLPEFAQVPIVMRADDDFSGDDLFKKTVYERDIEPVCDVKLVLDDRTHVVNMWRSLGIECWQVAPGDY